MGRLAAEHLGSALWWKTAASDDLPPSPGGKETDAASERREESERFIGLKCWGGTVDGQLNNPFSTADLVVCLYSPDIFI